MPALLQFNGKAEPHSAFIWVTEWCCGHFGEAILKTDSEFGSLQCSIPKHTGQSYGNVYIPQHQDENVSSLLSLQLGEFDFNHSHLHNETLNSAFGIIQNQSGGILLLLLNSMYIFGKCVLLICRAKQSMKIKERGIRKGKGGKIGKEGLRLAVRKQ